MHLGINDDFLLIIKFSEIFLEIIHCLFCNSAAIYQLTNKSILPKSSFTRQSSNKWTLKNRVFSHCHQEHSDFDPKFSCSYSKINKLISQNSPTCQNLGWWIVENWALGGFGQDFSSLYLWSYTSCESVNKKNTRRGLLTN